MKPIEEIFEDRGPVHGDFNDQFALSQGLKSEIHMALRSPMMDSVLQEALDHILVKISRIVVGDPTFDDHWADIIGYATLARKRANSLRHAKDFSKDFTNAK